MRDLSIWTILTFNILAILAFIFLRNRNAELLSAEQEKHRSAALKKENSIANWHNILYVVSMAVLVFYRMFFEVNLPANSIFYLMIAYLIFIAFRNRTIYQRTGLPEKYVNTEFSLSLSMVLITVINVFGVF